MAQKWAIIIQKKNTLISSISCGHKMNQERQYRWRIPNAILSVFINFIYLLILRDSHSPCLFSADLSQQMSRFDCGMIWEMFGTMNSLRC